MDSLLKALYLHNKIAIAHHNKIESVHHNKIEDTRLNKIVIERKARVMATIQERLADSLKELQKLQNRNGLAVVRSTDLSRVHLTRLVRNGFLQEVMKGWYISSCPDSSPGDTTNWYTSFWYFVVEYAKSRFGNDWCLSPDQSLTLHSGNFTVPKQVLLRYRLHKIML